MKKDMEIKTENGMEFDILPSPFEVSDTTETSDWQSMTASQLTEKYTGKQLAYFACEFISANPDTVAKWSKKDIIAVILNKGIDKKSTPKGSSSKSESTKYIETFTDILNRFKISRQNEPLVKPLRETFETAATNILAEKEAKGELSYSGASMSIASIAGVLLVIDGLIGFHNIPNLFKKIKEKINARTNKTAKE